MKELQQKAEAGGVKIEAHYDAKKNTTVVHIQKERGEDGGHEKKMVVSGAAIVWIKTNSGAIEIDY